MINLADWKEYVTPDFLKGSQINPRIFSEVFSPITSKMKINDFKFSINLNEADFFHIIHNLPISFEIMAKADTDLEIGFSEEQKEEFRRSISFYIYLRTIIQVKRTYADPILKLVYDRNGNQRLTGPVLLFLRKIAKRENEKIDSETLNLVSQLDLILRNNFQEIGYEPNKKLGRPSNILEDHFVNEVKRVLTKQRKYYHSDLETIIHFLKTNYHHSFSELPLSSEAIKKSLNNKVNLMEAPSQT